MAGPILLMMNAEKSAKKAVESKKRNRGLSRVLHITSLMIMLLFLLFLIHATALTTLPSHFVSLFSFVKSPFCPDPSSEEEPASLEDRKDIGETTAPISFLHQDQIVNQVMLLILKKLQGLLKEHVDFWMNSIRASDFIINTIVEGYKIPFFDLLESFVIPN